MDLARMPGAGIGRDISKGEQVEREIDQFIQKRHEGRVRDEGERCKEEIWAASERTYFAHQAEEQRLARLAFHEGQAVRLSSTLGHLVAYHEEQAEKYRPKGDAA